MRKVVAALALATGLALFSSPAHAEPARSASPDELTVSQSTVRQDTSLVAVSDAGSGAAATQPEALGVPREELLANTTGALALVISDVAPGLIAGVSLIVGGGLLLLAVRRRSSTA
jgi:hypothetical protein